MMAPPGYPAELAEFFAITNDRGVLTVRAHTDGGPALWSLERHQALHRLFSAVGADDSVELLVLTGTGDRWLGGRDLRSFAAQDNDSEVLREESYDSWYANGIKLLERLLWSIDVPTVGVVNGPGFHTEIALLCDLTLAADDARFFEPHFAHGLVPGDGLLLILQELVGLKRAAHLMYVAGVDGIDAPTALAWGLINEVHPRAALTDRTGEIADLILSQPRVVRRLTTQVIRRPWKRRFTDDFAMQYAHEVYGAVIAPIKHASFARDDGGE